MDTSECPRRWDTTFGLTPSKNPPLEISFLSFVIGSLTLNLIGRSYPFVFASFHGIAFLKLFPSYCVNKNYIAQRKEYTFGCCGNKKSPVKRALYNITIILLFNTDLLFKGILQDMRKVNFSLFSCVIKPFRNSKCFLNGLIFHLISDNVCPSFN